jgi:hypothetical protein
VLPRPGSAEPLPRPVEQHLESAAPRPGRERLGERPHLVVRGSPGAELRQPATGRGAISSPERDQHPRLPERDVAGMGRGRLRKHAVRVIQSARAHQRSRPGQRRRRLAGASRQREHRERLGVGPRVRERETQGDAQRRPSLHVGGGAQGSHVRLREALAALDPAAEALEHPGIHARSNENATVPPLTQGKLR